MPAETRSRTMKPDSTALRQRPERVSAGVSIQEVSDSLHTTLPGCYTPCMSADRLQGWKGKWHKIL